MADRAFNPNRPCVIGLEWRPNFNFSSPLAAGNGLASVLEDAQTSDVIEAIWTAMFTLQPDAGMAVEIFDVTNGSDPPALPAFSNILTTTTLPSAVISGTSFGSAAWGYADPTESTPPVGSPWTFVDQTTRTPGVFRGQAVGADTFLFQGLGLNFDSAFKFAIGAGSFVGKWITRVRVRIQASSLAFGIGGGGSSTPAIGGIVPFLVINGTQYFGAQQSISSQAPGTVATLDFYANPATGLPWTAADMDRFDDASADQWGAGFVAIGSGNVAAFTVVEEVALQIDAAATDQRLAIGATAVPLPAGQTSGWVELILRDTDTGLPTTITLTPGDSYAFQYRSTRSPNVYGAGINRIGAAYDGTTNSEPLAAPPNWITWDTYLDLASRRPLTVVQQDSTVAATVLVKNDSSISADSQPYTMVTPTQGAQEGWPTLPGGLIALSQISFGQWLHQEFTVDTGTTFEVIELIVSTLTTTTADPNQPLQTAQPLVINIRLTADDSLVAGPFTVELTDLEPPYTAWQRVIVDIGSVALSGATSYYFDVTSNANPFVAWQVQVAATGNQPTPTGPPAGTDDVTWGAGIDALHVFLFSVDQGADTYNTAEIAIATRPDPPVNFQAAAIGENDCGIDGILIQWATPALTCGVLDYVEIQRSDDFAVTWTEIARITDDTVTAFTDWESLRNMQAFYRARLVRVDGAPSDWTGVAAAIAVQSRVGLLFVSNEAPELNVFYPDLGPRTFDRPGQASLYTPIGQKYRAMIHDLADRGVGQSTRVAVRSGIPGCPPQLVTCDDQTLIGSDVFNPLYAISIADLSYVCIHNEHGNRYFAGLMVGKGTWRPLNVETWICDIQWIQLTDTPSRPDVAAPSGS